MPDLHSFGRRHCNIRRGRRSVPGISPPCKNSWSNNLALVSFCRYLSGHGCKLKGQILWIAHWKKISNKLWKWYCRAGLWKSIQHAGDKVSRGTSLAWGCPNHSKVNWDGHFWLCEISRTILIILNSLLFHYFTSKHANVWYKGRIA